MIERLLPLSRSRDEDAQIFDQLTLADKVLELARAKRLVELQLVFESFR
ncbi:MAG: hypothetical protein HW389_46 [Bacteroidetes bacterium]|nr:hypothetical protein [Bacteroidota bacterium]